MKRIKAMRQRPIHMTMRRWGVEVITDTLRVLKGYQARYQDSEFMMPPEYRELRTRLLTLQSLLRGKGKEA